LNFPIDILEYTKKKNTRNRLCLTIFLLGKEIQKTNEENNNHIFSSSSLLTVCLAFAAIRDVNDLNG